MKKRIRICKIVLLLIIICSFCSVLASLSVLSADVEQTEGARTLADLNKPEIKLGVLAGDASELLSKKCLPKAQLIYTNDINDHPVALVAGRIDGFIAYDNRYHEILKAYPELVALPESVEKSPSAFFTAKSDRGDALISEFNEFLSKLKADGTLKSISNKWVYGDESERVMPVQTSQQPQISNGETKDKGQLDIVYAFYEYPNNYVQNGEVVGVNVEIMSRFCMDRGYTPVLHSVSSVASAIMGVVGGKYDICASRTVPSEERAESVKFTSRVSDVVTHLIVRRSDVAADVLARIDKKNGVVRPQVVDSEPTLSDSVVEFWNGLVSSFEKNFIRENRWQMLLNGLLLTIQLAALSALFGTFLGGVICYMRMRKNRFVHTIAAAYVKIFQGTPIVVLLLVLYYVIFGSTNISAFLVCVVGFSLEFSAYVSEMMRTGIEAVPTGQREAALALGYGQTKTFFEIILPQAIRHILPVYRGQLVTMVKMTSIAGYISVEDLTKVSDIIRSRTYEAFFPLICTAIIYFLLASILTKFLMLIQLRTDPNNRKRLPKGVK